MSKQPGQVAGNLVVWIVASCIIILAIAGTIKLIQMMF